MTEIFEGVLTNQLGRPPRSTVDERADVFRLADAGLSQRAIAERVYGDPRFQLRVLRLLRRRRTWEDADLETRRRCEEQLEELRALDLVDDVARARSQQVLDDLARRPIEQVTLVRPDG